ncbi:hypothetical protein SteCoe_35018 [Stentor coeruleus]|uniref:sn-1-specific diacylglycerol lipase n=1 Tax=Stentor coeruleus TaxID=5963 RepID=A0A1R2AT91_9CILI|nr:hypothetical protein SteCoe_35018 [Stentor coeruleus]
MESLKEKSYKIISASAATLDTLARPAVKHSHKLMIEGSSQIESSLNSFLNNMQVSSPERLSWVFKGLKKANSSLQKLTRTRISMSYEDSMGFVQGVENYLTSEQISLENYFKENNLKVHHNWIFSDENRQIIKELNKLIADLTKDIKTIPYHKIWQYCMAYVYIQKHARRSIWKAPILHQSQDMVEGARNLKYYTKYAIAIYGKILVSALIEKSLQDLLLKEDEDIFCSYVGINKILLVYSHMGSRRGIPSHIISIDILRKAVVVTIRGTQSIFDCMTDLKSDYCKYTFFDPKSGEPLSTGLVHSGILQSSWQLSSEIKSIVLSCLSDWNGFSVVLVGHSLGAAVSSMLALIWLSDHDFADVSIVAYAYAPPPLVTRELNVLLEKRVYSCIFGNDIVGRLCYGSVQDLAEMIHFFYRKENEDPSFSASSIATEWLYDINNDPSKLLGLYNEIKNSFKAIKLEPPGQILQVYNKYKHSDHVLFPLCEDDISGSYVDGSFYSEIILDKTCFLDHLPQTYEESILAMPIQAYHHD